MYGAQPSHNYLPWDRRPGAGNRIEPEDWEHGVMDLRIRWLSRWHAYFQKVCYAEMLTHRFLTADHTLQRVEYANGVVADFDLDKGLFRVQGIDGFAGEWEQPEQFPPQIN